MQFRSTDSQFQNLFHLLPDFEDFNWTTFLDRLEQPKGEHIARVLGHAFETGDSGELDPSLSETLARTLSPLSCEAFFRTHPDYPFTHRDYYLSKVFQFTWVALIYGGFERCQELWDRLNSVVSEIRDADLPQLHDRFSIHRFFRWTRDHLSNTSGLIDALESESFLDDFSRDRNHSRQPEDQFCSLDRETLYAQWRSRHPERGALTEMLEKWNVDDSDFRKWRGGKKFPDDSQVSERIVRGLGE